MRRTSQFYAVGKSEEELLAYDEYDSKGSGLYFTSDLLMIDRYTKREADQTAYERKLAVYLVTIDKTDSDYKTEVALMHDVDEVQQMPQKDKSFPDGTYL